MTKKISFIFACFFFYLNCTNSSAATVTAMTIEELRNMPIVKHSTAAKVLGYYTPNDGSGGPTRSWDPNSTCTDNGGSCIDPISPGPGRWTFAAENIDIGWYGAYGDGIHDDTSAIQMALNEASSNNTSVHDHANKKYLISTIYIKNGIKSINFTNGTLLPKGTTNPNKISKEAAIVITGPTTGAKNVVSGAIMSFNIDMKYGDRTAILMDGTTDCIIENCKIFGFTNNQYNHRGIRIQEAASRNTIRYNKIIGYKNPRQRGLLIDIWGVPSAIFSGFFDGSIKKPTKTAMENSIIDNVLIDGSYAVSLQSAQKSIISRNICDGQNHRSIYLANASSENVISYNKCLNFSSSGVLIGYGSSNNRIEWNDCLNSGRIGLGGEASININTGSSNNIIQNNNIDAPANYAIYIATDSSNTIIKNNTVKNYYIAAISVENDWVGKLPKNAFYSRPNYADPTKVHPTAKSWTFNDLSGTKIIGNTIGPGYPGRQTAAISLAQIDNIFDGTATTSLNGTTIENNSITSMEGIRHCLYVYEHTPGKLLNLKTIGNTWHKDATIDNFSAGTQDSSSLNLKKHGLIYSANDSILDSLFK